MAKGESSRHSDEEEICSTCWHMGFVLSWQSKAAAGLAAVFPCRKMKHPESFRCNESCAAGLTSELNMKRAHKSSHA